MRGRPKGSTDVNPRKRRENVRSTSTVVQQVFNAATEAGVSLYTIADHLGMSRVGVSYYRSGRSTPTILTMEEIADLLGCEIKLVKKENSRVEA